MKSRLLSVTVIASALIAASALWAAPKLDKSVKCPVSGKAINPDAGVAFNGGTVYFCCKNCPKAFAADTDKYAAKANHQLVQTEQLKQVACPLTGKKVNPAVSVNIDGVKVGLCCNGCKKKINSASDDEKVEMVFKDTSKGYKPAQY